MKMVFKEEITEHEAFHSADIDRMEKILAANDIEVSRLDIYKAWSEHSASFCAGWLGITGDTDKGILHYLMTYLEEV